MPQVGSAAQVINVGLFFELRGEGDWLFEWLIAPRLLEVLAHVVVHAALKGEQAGEVAKLVAMGADAKFEGNLHGRFRDQRLEDMLINRLTRRSLFGIRVNLDRVVINHVYQ